LHLGVRNELFMAFRDRLKGGDTADALRKHLRDMLADSELGNIAKRRKSSLNIDDQDAGKMLRDLTRNLTINETLTKILRQTFHIPVRSVGASSAAERHRDEKVSKRKPREVPPFDPQRFPSTFRVRGGDGEESGLKLFKLPLGGNRLISFATDVENDYFDRTNDPGELSLAILRPQSNAIGGGEASAPSGIGDVLAVTRSSPTEGAIKVGVRASGEVKVGDAFELRAALSSPSGDLVETVMVKVTDPERKPPANAPVEEPPPGIPELVLCAREGGDGRKSWSDLQDAGIEMDHNIVVQPFVDDEKLSRIYINVDSSVLKDFNRTAKSTEAIELTERRYVSTIYFHTLFLFATTKSRKYAMQRGDGEKPVDVDVAEYISDLFSASYAQFLLSFDTGDLIDAIG
jgi:hypothetical protein